MKTFARVGKAKWQMPSVPAPTLSGYISAAWVHWAALANRSVHGHRVLCSFALIMGLVEAPQKGKNRL